MAVMRNEKGEFCFRHRLKLSNVHILDVQAEPTSDGKGVNLRFPVSADVSVTLPIVRKLVNLKASLDLTIGVRVENNPQTGVPTVLLSECSNDPSSISLSLLDRQNALVNGVVDSMTSFLSNTVSFMVQKQLCPLIRLFLSNLDAEFVANTINKIQQGAEVQIQA
ncbi:BPI fold-containing family A member 2 [Rhynchonycteris naso]